MKKILLTIGTLALLANSGIQPQTFIFNKNTSWSYKDNNYAQPDVWKTQTYDISSRSLGNGPLGYIDPVTTTINSGLIKVYSIEGKLFMPRNLVSQTKYYQF